jgi:hypothetical protein
MLNGDFRPIFAIRAWAANVFRPAPFPDTWTPERT